MHLAVDEIFSGKVFVSKLLGRAPVKDLMCIAINSLRYKLGTTRELNLLCVCLVR